MSEGPQVRLQTERLATWLTGRTVSACIAARPDLEACASDIVGTRVEAVFCKGKRIFISFGNGKSLHNHLLMRGKWRRRAGGFLFAPPGAWLMIGVGSWTVININGQRLEYLSEDDVAKLLNDLGPDLMTEPLPEAEVITALRESRLPLAEALLDQSVVCGIGNVAKSEALHLAGIAPDVPAAALRDPQLARLCKSIQSVLWASYRSVGRWTHRVYRRTGRRCDVCGARIRMMRLPPSRRATWYCPACQKSGT